jgi:hypothetical protein
MAKLAWILVLCFVYERSVTAQQASPLKGQPPIYSSVSPYAAPGSGFNITGSLFWKWVTLCGAPNMTLSYYEEYSCPIGLAQDNLTIAAQRQIWTDAYNNYYNGIPKVSGVTPTFITDKVYISMYLDRYQSTPLLFFCTEFVSTSSPSIVCNLYTYVVVATWKASGG